MDLTKRNKDELINIIMQQQGYIEELEEKLKSVLGALDDAIAGEDATSEILKERYSELKSNFDKSEYIGLSYIATLADIFDSEFLRALHDYILKHKRGHKGATMEYLIRFAKGLSGSVEEEEKPSLRERIRRRLRGE